MVMWLAELITQRGIGNGMSILIFASVVSRLPAQGSAIWSQGSKFQFFTIIAIGIAMIVGIVFVESGQRRIPVQFAKRVVGRRMYGGQSTYIPLKVNQSGVIPVIFASSILSFPALIASALGDNFTGVQEWINDNLVNHQGWWYIVFYTLLIIFFSYFYTAIAFNPRNRPTSSASRVASSPASGPDHRPSATSPRCSTASRCRARCSSPSSRSRRCWCSRSGTSASSRSAAPSLLITVGVALETMKQIDSQLMMRNYEGFLA